MSWLSDTWEDAKGMVDDVGDAAEETIESTVENVGQTLDSGLDAAAGLADRVGAGGLSDALTDLGDEIASATGGAVDELDLGQTEEPKELIRGEPSAITEATNTLTDLATSIGSTGDALRTVDAADWTGSAADGFNEVFDKQPGLWHDAADAMTAAAQTLTSWSHTVEAAQARATDAVAKWKQAEAEERAKKTAFNALSGDEQAASPLVDTWTALREEARDILRGARAERDGVAGQVSGALDAATSSAPAAPSFTERWMHNATDAIDGTHLAVANFYSGLGTGLTGIVQFVRQVNPYETYNMTHPAEYQASMSNLATGLVVAAADPGAMVSGVVSDIRKNPFEFAGSLTGDALLTAATGGAGAGVAGARTAVRLVDEAGDFGSGARLLDDVADVGHIPKPDTPHVDSPTQHADTHPTSAETHLPEFRDTDRSDTGSPSSPDPQPGTQGDDSPIHGNDSEQASEVQRDVDGSPDPYERGIRYLDEEAIGYVDEDGETVQTRYLEHPARDLIDDARIDTNVLSPDDTLPGLSSDSPEVVALSREFLERGEVDPEDLKWPDSKQYPDGFSSPTDRHPAVLEPGARIDRFGDPNGRFVSPEGVPYHERALPPSNLERGYHRYEVLREIPVWVGQAAPAQGMPGGGLQYLSSHTVEELISGGYLREVG
ncbi:TNT domain-containing protein [Rhodococcus tibetensis]|uniref:TNT domain-containing protein n=1 Tax=Rhodococcus tibetensis TaxID=2965064 RepID=A0ABT1QCM3_9NOCA|nr:TNT domain-containing protein [Rhodococcus sp. FXJ9.536]MCQ4119490.1 TNT domain-containing protein [Rhodococcus sp. FXJ9.536]